MPLSLNIHREAEKRLYKLPRSDNSLIWKKIFLLAQTPLPSGVKKLERFGFYRVRVGDYRIVYHYDPKAEVIDIYAIEPRQQVYKKLQRSRY